MCSQASDTCFAVVRSKAKDTKNRELLLQWPYSCQPRPIEQAATQTVLPSAAHSVHLVPASSSSVTSPAGATSVLIVYQDGAVALEPAVSNGQSVSTRPEDLTVEASSYDHNLLAVLLSAAAKPAIQLHAVRVSQASC